MSLRKKVCSSILVTCLLSIPASALAETVELRLLCSFQTNETRYSNGNTRSFSEPDLYVLVRYDEDNQSSNVFISSDDIPRVFERNQNDCDDRESRCSVSENEIRYSIGSRSTGQRSFVINRLSGQMEERTRGSRERSTSTYMCERAPSRAF